jgi:heterodisulfide reductase subunit A-like polyferredoxin
MWSLKSRSVYSSHVYISDAGPPRDLLPDSTCQVSFTVDNDIMAEARALDIIIIGAGIAGLTAAGALGRQGHHVVVGLTL